MALTLEQVARLAGVSRSTVSRVINDSPNVRPEVRDRVWQVIQQHNYQPHQAARSLMTHRTNAIGLIIPEAVTRLFSDPFFPELTQGIAEVCNERGFCLVLVVTTNNTDRDALYRRVLLSRQLDGAIVASATLGDPVFRRLQESHTPAVLVGRHPGFPDIPWVDVDNVAGARNMTQYLLDLGHRRIGTISGPLDTPVGLDRLAGYRQALEAAGLTPDDSLQAEGDFTEDSGYYAMRRLLRSEPTAVFAASDVMAAGAIRALLQAGLRVPEDVSVAGYDDAPIATRVVPPLTTVQQVVLDLGRAAADRLVTRIEQPDTPVQPLVLPTRLVARQSTRGL